MIVSILGESLAPPNHPSATADTAKTMAAQRRASESPVVFKEMIARKKSANLAVFATQITATASSEFLGIDETQTCEEIEQILDEADIWRPCRDQPRQLSIEMGTSL